MRGDWQVALVNQNRLADAAAASGESQALFESFRTRIGDLRTQAQTIQSDLQAQLSRARGLQFAVTTGLDVLGPLAVITRVLG